MRTLNQYAIVYQLYGQNHMDDSFGGETPEEATENFLDWKPQARILGVVETGGKFDAQE